jgi:hypothetical protein
MGKNLPSRKAALSEQLRHGLCWRLGLAMRNVVVGEAGEQPNVLLLSGNGNASLGLLLVRFLLLANISMNRTYELSRRKLSFHCLVKDRLQTKILN